MKPINILGKCCVCGLVHVDGRWVMPDQAGDGYMLFSHGYCPACLKKALTELALAELCLEDWSGVATGPLATQRVAVARR